MAITSFLAHTDDNWIEHTGATWSTVKNATVGTTVGVATSTSAGIHVQAPGNFIIRRYYCYFDTSSLPDSAVITRVVLTLWRVSGSAGSVGSQDTHLVFKGTFPTGALSTSHFGSIDTSLGDLYLSAISGLYNGANYSTPFIRDGVSATNYVGCDLKPSLFTNIINKSGVSKFVVTAFRDNPSIVTVAPTAGTDGNRVISTANDILANRPLLTIEWSLPNPLANYLTN